MSTAFAILIWVKDRHPAVPHDAEMDTRAQFGDLGLFDAKVPLYTSYPTASHFNSTVRYHQINTWIEAVPEGARISLYVHVPFCRRLCWFCACRTQGTQNDRPVRAYLETLKTEIAMLGRALPRGIRLSRLHWGGGTPTLLRPGMIDALAGAIRDIAPFTDTTEFSVEIDPGEIDAPRLDALAAAGMTRASIGVQDFDPNIQKRIGRVQGYDITRWATEEIRARGITGLDADILYGLPDQTGTRITDSVQKLLSLDPDRIALNGYAHVPWMARRQQMIPSETLPTPQQRLQLFETARRLFLWDGYTEIGIDHFARPEDGLSIARKTHRLRRNFQGYTDDTSDVLIGLGASAISRFPQGYAQNAPATSSYTSAIRDGRFATARGHVFSDADRLRGRMIEALMCDFRIDATEITRDFDITQDVLHTLLSEISRAFAGHLRHDTDGLTIPSAARPLTRMIARRLDLYAPAQQRHSSAI